MEIVILIVCVLYLALTITTKNKYVNYYNGFCPSNLGEEIGHYLGTFFACCTEGVAWWYIIQMIVKHINL